MRRSERDISDAYPYMASLDPMHSLDLAYMRDALGKSFHPSCSYNPLGFTSEPLTLHLVLLSIHRTTSFSCRVCNFQCIYDSFESIRQSHHRVSAWRGLPSLTRKTSGLCGHQMNMSSARRQILSDSCKHRNQALAASLRGRIAIPILLEQSICHHKSERKNVGSIQKCGVDVGKKRRLC